VSAHLVAAACHPSPDVALYAEDMLHALAAKLLARAADLVNFRWGARAVWKGAGPCFAVR